jgi:mannose/fructose/N-acetylgalactosamine-specific phosphotransferase system component IIB
MPASPLTNCEFTFEPGTSNIYINFNGQTAALPGSSGNVTQWVIPDVSTFRTFSASISLQYTGTPSPHWEQSGFSSPLYLTTVQPTNAAQLAHGQVYFQWNSSASQFDLCTRNGPGGIIVDGQMRQVPLQCLALAQSATTSSAINYFYAVHTVQDTNLLVNGATLDPSGDVLLTFSSTTPVLGNVNDLVAITCVSIGGAIEANGNNVGLIEGTNAIELLNPPPAGLGTYSTGGSCDIVRLAASPTGHYTADNGVEEMIGGTGHYTLVGMCYIGPSNAVYDTPGKRDCASWFNRKLKTCISSFVSNHSTASTSFVELSSEIECDFVTWGTGDPIVESDLAWSISGMAENNLGNDGAVVTAGFDGISPEREQTALLNPPSPAISGFPISVRGSKTGLLEDQLHYITLLGKALTGGSVTVYGAPLDVATSLEVSIPQ